MRGMQAIRISAHGGPEAMSWVELPTPTPGPGDVRVRVHAAGVNFIDVYYRSGLYKKPLPTTLGEEGAGVVEQVGDGVTLVAVGDRVAWAGQSSGSYATHVLVPAARLVRIPGDLDAVQAAAAMLQGMTAHYLARSTFPLRQGHTCLIHAAAGGVGLLLCQMAKRAGARVIGTVSTADKGELARQAGASDVIVYTEQDFEAETRALTSGRGVDVVYDSVGKTTFAKSLNVLAPLGTLVLFGQSSGPVEPFDPLLLTAKGSLFLTRPSLGHYVSTPEELGRRAGEVLASVKSGELALRIGATFAMSRAADAHRALESRVTSGKIVLVP